MREISWPPKKSWKLRWRSARNPCGTRELDEALGTGAAWLAGGSLVICAENLAPDANPDFSECPSPNPAAQAVPQCCQNQLPGGDRASSWFQSRRKRAT